jgi:hypothetical protein
MNLRTLERFLGAVIATTNWQKTALGINAKRHKEQKMIEWQ